MVERCTPLASLPLAEVVAAVCSLCNALCTYKASPRFPLGVCLSFPNEEGRRSNLIDVIFVTRLTLPARSCLQQASPVPPIKNHNVEDRLLCGVEVQAPLSYPFQSCEKGHHTSLTLLSIPTSAWATSGINLGILRKRRFV